MSIDLLFAREELIMHKIEHRKALALLFSAINHHI